MDILFALTTGFMLLSLKCEFPFLHINPKTGGNVTKIVVPCNFLLPRTVVPMGLLTHWGRVTHTCISKLTIIGSDNGLLPDWCQAIIWTNAGILSIEPSGTKLSDILIAIHIFSFKKMYLKMSSGKWRPCCLGLNEVNPVDITENSAKQLPFRLDLNVVSINFRWSMQIRWAHCQSWEHCWIWLLNGCADQKDTCHHLLRGNYGVPTLIARSMGPTRGSSRANRTQVGPM